MKCKFKFFPKLAIFTLLLCLLYIQGISQKQLSDTTSAEYQIIKAVTTGNNSTFDKLLSSNLALLKVIEPTRQETLLLLAARFNQLEIAKKLIQKGVEVNALNSAGNTSLHLAVFTGNFELVQLLLDNGVDYQIKNSRGRTALEYVPFGKNHEVYKLFHAKDKNILSYKSREGANLLHWSANAGDTAGFTYLLKKGLDVKLEDNDGSNIMHWAMSAGNKDMLLYLKKKGLNYNFVSSRGFSPISAAMMWKSKSSIEFLLENGFQINQKFPPNNNTLFIEATANDATEIINYLIDHGADVNAADGSNFTAICWSVLNNNMELTKYLIEKGANVNKITNGGRSPIIMAIERDNVEMMKFLTEKGADLQKPDSLGITPLHRSTINGNLQAVSFLLSKGVPVNSQDKNGLCPLHYASIYGRVDIADLLIQKGANVKVLDNQKRDAVYYSAYYGNDKITQLLIKSGAKNPKLKAEPQAISTNLKEGKAVIHYLNHSGYAIETSKHLLIFDYFHYLAAPENLSLLNGRINPDELKGKKVVVFVSHDHSDHYDTTIWNWKLKMPDIKYVLGFQAQGQHSFEFMEAHQEKNIDEVNIHAIKSTDAGVGFLVETDGIVIYHPGDHVNKAVELSDEFKNEIDYLAGLKKKVDIAFYPVAGCGYPDLEGVKVGNYYVIEKLNPKANFSMHADANQCALFSKGVFTKFPEKQTYYAEFPGDRFFY